jgi:hypothetical protein
VLAHSPPLLLDPDYYGGNVEIATKDEEGAILALKQYNQVRRVCLQLLVTSLQKLIVAMEVEYPILEHLIISRPLEDNTSIFQFPETPQASNLRRLYLVGFSFPMGSRLLTTAVGLVTLILDMCHPSTYFYPNILLRWLSFMPQLETLIVEMYALSVAVFCWHLDWQVSFAAQIFYSLSPLFSALVSLLNTTCIVSHSKTTTRATSPISKKCPGNLHSANAM